MKQIPDEIREAIGRSPRLLIVDDDPNVIRLLFTVFHDTCEVFMELKHKHVIQKCADLMPDLILLDIELDGASGFDVCSLIKSDPRFAQIPIIFVTASLAEDDEIKGLQMGAVDFIHKPISAPIVLSRVTTHLAFKLQTDILRRHAMMDGLTGLGNRRQFEESFERELRACRRSQAPLSIIMADIDFFKKYNDTYGHQAGDKCLRLVARAIKGSMRRPTDLAARYGGEEFVCLLPNTDAAGAHQVAQNILELVADAWIEHAEGATPDKTVTVSIGVATTVPDDSLKGDNLVGAADIELYRAKAEGRARICAIDLGAPPPK